VIVDERALLAEKASAVERHLRRVADRLPADVAQFQPGTDASDAVVLHLWQAVQIAIDLAVSQCVRRHLGTPQSYREAFERLARANLVPSDLAERLARAAGFRNAVAHAYEGLDMKRVHAAATSGPADLRAFLACLRDAPP